MDDVGAPRGPGTPDDLAAGDADVPGRAGSPGDPGVPMDHGQLRPVLDAMDRDELLHLRERIRATPDGSMQEIEGVRLPKEQALKLINQALPVVEG